MYVGDRNEPKRKVDQGNPIGLLQCLERPYEVVREELKAREAELQMPPGSLIELVPLKMIPAAAVESQMDYWLEHALVWLSAMPVDDVDDVLLVRIQDAPWATQRARHQALRLMARRST
jgi:hypothetical protein